MLRRLQAIDATSAARERLRDVLSVFWEVYSTHTEYQRVVDYCERPDFKRRVGDPVRREMQELEAAFAALIHEIVKQGIAEGPCRTVRFPCSCSVRRPLSSGR